MNLLRPLTSLLRPALLIGLTPLLMSCGASLRDLYMSTDAGGNLKTTQFNSIGDEIHCIAVVIGGDEETKVFFELSGPGGMHITDEKYPRPTSDKQGPVKLDMFIYQIDTDGNKIKEGTVDMPWPLGDYKMDVSLDGELQETLEFSVVE